MQTLSSTQNVLKSIFGYDSFRPLQDECIHAVLEKKDCLLVMPTGGGKSLCYQIPALIFPGLTVVISPLISLMQDQFRQLHELGVDADLLNSTLTWGDYQAVKDRVCSGKTKILFLAPETLMKEDILMMLSQLPVDCVTIDEAHCISEWGHDFRPEYRKIKTIRANFPRAVFLAMTATATPHVRRDIIANLGFKDCKEFLASFNRDNLFYEVVAKTQPIDQVLDFLKRFNHQSGIIYCFSRKQVDSLTAELNQEGIKAMPYHAGLPDKTRQRHQELFIRDDVQIIVATIAFGMGINKPNVRFVIHYDLPKNIESYYQETGRAGRDGLSAHCLLLLGYGDIGKIRYLIDQKSLDSEKKIANQHLNAMMTYAEARVCRRIPLIRYFGEDYQVKRCGQCDNCVNPPEPTVDLTEVGQVFCRAVLKTGQRFGAGHIMDVMRGSKKEKVLTHGHNTLPNYGEGKSFSIQQWRHLIAQFIQQNIVMKEEEYGVLKLTQLGMDVLERGMKVEGYAPPNDRVVKSSRSSSSKAEHSISTANYDQDLFEVLKRTRKQLADKRGVPPYVIFPDKSLLEMSVVLPQTRSEFSEIFGVGQKKLDVFGDLFMSVIKEYKGRL